MKRRTAVAFCSLVVAASILATAGPASAAPLQDFYLTSNAGSDVAVAQGIVASGVGTFVETGPTSETILIAGENPIFMSQTPVFQAVTVDPRTCRAAVVERGTFEFSQLDGQNLFGGSGRYTLAGTVFGQRSGTGCVIPPSAQETATLTARATEVHVVA